MSVVRILAIMLFGLGLFVQSAAQASATPQAPSAMVDCADMATSQSMMAGADAARPMNREMPCKSMGLDCLVAMGCIGVPVLADFPAVEVGARFRAENPEPALIAGLNGHIARPESPPPQANLTA